MSDPQLLQPQPLILFTFTLDGRIVPKARPRLSANGRAMLPEGYRDWKDTAASDLMWQAREIGGIEAIEYPIAVAVEYQGSAVGDADNMLGSILDALVDASILKNDGLNIVSQVSFKWKKNRVAKAKIVIQELS